MKTDSCPCDCHRGGLDTPCNIAGGCHANHGASNAKAAQSAVDELIEAVGWLAATLMPGTAKPYREPRMSQEKRDKRAMEDRTYRLLATMGNTVPLGESPAPMDLAVMDLLVEILEFAVGLSMLPAPDSAFEDPRRFLRSIEPKKLLGRDLVRLERDCDDWTYQVHAQLGLFGDGQVLKSCCPWCGGRTEQAPTGGVFTLRVRVVLPRGKRTMAGVDPREIRWLVVCTGGSCEPSSKDVGTWWRGLPAWDIATEGSWLADRLAVAS